MLVLSNMCRMERRDFVISESFVKLWEKSWNRTTEAAKYPRMIRFGACS